MKRFLLCLTAILLFCAAALADSKRVRSLVIYVDLDKDGTATIAEEWDVSTGNKITEWYLVRDNLGDITIDNFRVLADDKPMADDGEWNTERSLEEKAGKYGIVHKRDGVELCWGIAPRGDHVYNVVYQMHGAVKSLRDYDLLHLQLVSPGMSSAPEKVTVAIGSDHLQMDTTHVRIWGFGYEGTCIFEDGMVVMQSDGPLDSEDSVIALLRLDKGILEPTSVRDQDFQQVLDKAMEGADFGNDEEEKNEKKSSGRGLKIFIALIIGFIAWRRYKRYKKGNKLIGTPLAKVKKDEVEWYRDIPMDGHLAAAHKALELTGDEDSTLRHYTSALILRMVYNGYLKVSRLVESESTEIRFTDEDPELLDTASKHLYNMLKAAAGENAVLEKKEFSDWADKHRDLVWDWNDFVEKSGQKYLKDKGYIQDYTIITESGAQEIKHLWGLRKFLGEFTLTDQREAFEASLWKEYLVYGSLLGVARKVASQLKEIAPGLYNEINVDATMDGTGDFAFLIYDAFRKQNDYLESRARQSRSYSSSSSRSGYGGRSSRCGGGGFSGGGRGGGGR